MTGTASQLMSNAQALEKCKMVYANNAYLESKQFLKSIILIGYQSRVR